MSQGTYKNTMIRLEACKKIFAFRPNIDFFLRGKSRNFGQKLTNFVDGIVHLFMIPGISECRKSALGNIFKLKERHHKEFSVSFSA